MLLDIISIPLLWWALIAAGLGVIIGSFLNVFIYRFHTGKSLAGHSHCLSCGVQLRWFDLFPVFSFLFLRAKCRACGCRISIRYFVVELLTGVLFFMTIYTTIDIFEIFIYFFLLSVFVVILVYDYNHFIIPDSLTAVATVLISGLLAYRWFVYSYSLTNIGWDILAAVCGAAFLLFLWIISRGQWLGFGDVKLAVPLGLFVGASYVFSFIVMSFWVGAVISLLLLGYLKYKRGKIPLQLQAESLTMKSAVPFAPFMIAAALIVFFFNINVLTFFQIFV